MGSSAVPLILIVGDDAVIAHLVAVILTQHGCQTRIAPHAEAAVGDLKLARPALVTLDLDLPGMSGAAFLQQLRADVTTAALPVIIITGQHEIPLETQELANAVLAKPFGVDELTAVVGAAIAAQVLAERAVGGAPYVDDSPSQTARPDR